MRGLCYRIKHQIHLYSDRDITKKKPIRLFYNSILLETTLEPPQNKKTKPINSWFVPVINRFFIFEAISKYRKQSDNKYSSWWRPISASSNCILCSDMYDYAPSLYTHKSFFILHYPWHHKFWTEGVEGSGILCVNCSLSWRFMHEACIWCIAAMTVTHFSSHWVNSLQLNQQRLQLKIYKYVLWI